MSSPRIGRSFRYLVTVALLFSSLTAGAYQRGAPLTLNQIEGLLSLRTPDSIIAAEIRERQVAFPLLRSIFNRLRDRGAGPMTLQALVPFIREPRFTLVTRPPAANAEFRLAGHSYTADASGRATITDLPPGTYDVAFHHQQFQERTYRVVIPENDLTQELQVESARGRLTITPSFPDTRIVVEGLGTWNNEVRNLACDAKSYKVSITARYFLPWSNEVTVPPGDAITVKPDLTVDPEAVKSESAAARNSVLRGDWRTADVHASIWLRLQPSEPGALSILTSAYYHLNEFDKAFSYGRQALDEGAELEFPVLHHHNNVVIATHQARIKISAGQFGFDPKGTEKVVGGTENIVECNFKAFAVPMSLIDSVQVNPAQDNVVMLNLRLIDPKNPKKNYTLNFADYMTRLQKGSGGLFRGDEMIPRPQGQESLRVLAQLIEAAKSRRRDA